MKKINDLCIQLYEKKIQILNIINKDPREYELKLIHDKELLNIWTHLHSLLVLLWENPKYVAYILMNAKPKVISDSLLPLFANNFYDNILSQKFLQNNLLYVLTLLLKHEIKSYCSFLYPKHFLNINSSCGYLLYELRNKRDFQLFLKEVIEEEVDMLNDYPYDLCFNLDKIALNISQQFEIIKGNNESDKKNNLSEDSLMKEIMKFESKIIGLKNLEIIKKKYFSKDLDLDNDF